MTDQAETRTGVHSSGTNETGSLRVMTRGMRMLLWIAGALVLFAGVQLFVFPENTDEYFAWTIDVPLTAAFLGAGYWASVVFEWLAAREKLWANARVAVPSVFVFTTLTLVATLLHLDLFHLDPSFGPATRFVTWAWIAIYSTVPVAMTLLFVKQQRASGRDPARTAPLPRGVVAVLAVHALGLPIFGAYLFINPESAASLWPWPLTALTARAVGAWVFSLGIAAAHALWEGDVRRVRLAARAYVAVGVLQFLALARYPDTVAWDEPQAIVYAVTLASMIVSGAMALGVSRGYRNA
ncbi:MAG: hypothetical protein ACRDK3_10560 [Actinomycetota bacterium]